MIGTSNFNSPDNVPDAPWECFVDNVSIHPEDPHKYPENNWVFCHVDSLPDSLHNITLRATVRNQYIFWFDRIEYSPSSSANLDSSLITINARDLAVTYGPGWQDLRNVGKMTLQQEANATVEFSGEYLSCMGQKSGLQ